MPDLNTVEGVSLVCFAFLLMCLVVYAWSRRRE
jgi:Mg2+ and Co2+ transporter CorA